jgi:hypothetical protein
LVNKHIDQQKLQRVQWLRVEVTLPGLVTMQKETRPV